MAKPTSTKRNRSLGTGWGRGRTPHTQGKPETVGEVRAAIRGTEDLDMPYGKYGKGFDERNCLGNALANGAIVPVAKGVMDFVAGAIVVEKMVDSTEAAIDNVRMPQFDIESRAKVDKRDEE